jgi:hypothetical protein
MSMRSLSGGLIMLYLHGTFTIQYLKKLPLKTISLQFQDQDPYVVPDTRAEFR